MPTPRQASRTPAVRSASVCTSNYGRLARSAVATIDRQSRARDAGCVFTRIVRSATVLTVQKVVSVRLTSPGRAGADPFL